MFALPSTMEGVGIVALDAAYYGCEIVITHIKGPKEYYHGQCLEVNPFSVKDIGLAIVKFLNGEVVYQPELSQMIAQRYSQSQLAQNLIRTYLQCSKKILPKPTQTA